MKNKSKQKKVQKDKKEDISRKDAIKKVGKYAAITATSMLIILHPKKAQAGSPPDPGWGT